jgi:hypothetical protein
MPFKVLKNKIRDFHPGSWGMLDLDFFHAGSRGNSAQQKGPKRDYSVKIKIVKKFSEFASVFIAKLMDYFCIFLSQHSEGRKALFSGLSRHPSDREQRQAW